MGGSSWPTVDQFRFGDTRIILLYLSKIYLVYAGAINILAFNVWVLASTFKCFNCAASFFMQKTLCFCFLSMNRGNVCYFSLEKQVWNTQVFFHHILGKWGYSMKREADIFVLKVSKENGPSYL